MVMYNKVILLWILLPTFIDFTAGESKVFVVDSVSSGSISMGSFETLEFVTIPLENIGIPVAVDYDPVDEKVYWTDVEKNTIDRANVDGTEQEVVLQLGSENDPTPDGLAIDMVNRHLYWTDINTKKIERANLDGSNRQTILDVDLDKPRAIVVDPAGQHIYWTDWGEIGRIERANLDGTDRRILVDTNIGFPNGIFINFEKSRLYWCDAELNRIESTDLNGGNRMINFSSPIDTDIHPFDIVVYKDTIYWTDWFLSRIIQLPFGSSDAIIVGPEFNRPAGMHVYQDPLVLACDPSSISQVAPAGQTSAQVTFEAVPSGGVPPYNVQYSQNPGSNFNIGTTEVTASAIDSTEAQAACTFIIIVTADSLNIACPGDVSVTVLESQSIIVFYEAAVASGGMPPYTITYNRESGTTFNVGDTTVIATVIDAGGFAAQCSFIVTVSDSVPPTISNCPNDIAVTASIGSDEATVSWTPPTASDNITPTSLINTTATHSPGQTFPVGLTIVTYIFSDEAGNQATCTFNVFVAEATPCTSDPCLNNGECIFIGDQQYVCRCIDGFTGDRCEIATPCSSSPCLNNGLCILTDNIQIGYLCQCYNGFTGDRCEIGNACSSRPCLNGGGCLFNAEFGYICMCANGFKGDRCEIVDSGDPCSSSPCRNQGVCTTTGDTFTCNCDGTGFIGRYCADVDSCLQPCSNPGDPIPMFCPRCNTYDDCLKDNLFGNFLGCRTLCNPNPCENAGQCILTNNEQSYRCQCSSGFTGVRCQNARPPCESSPCRNGATCMTSETGQEYYCHCTNRYTGRRCETALTINPCQSLPCLYGGTCMVDSTGQEFNCDCAARYTGDRCQTVILDPLNPCEPSPCMNEGTCMIDSTGYHCACTDKYAGDRCQTEVIMDPRTPCSSFPCQNGGVCAELGGLIMFYLCSCPAGFMGNNCQFSSSDVNPCLPNPCLNGQCVTQSSDSGGMFTCNCYNGYTGDRCDVRDANPCLPSPCINGQCVTQSTDMQGVFTYTCICSEGYSGSLCDITDVNPCLPSPCINGQCVTRSTDTQGVFTYMCICSVGYTGVQCDIRDDVVLKCPKKQSAFFRTNQTSSETGPGTIVMYLPAVITSGTGTYDITYSRPSGSFFPYGLTRVNVTALTESGISVASCHFEVCVNAEDGSVPLQPEQTQMAQRNYENLMRIIPRMPDGRVDPVAFSQPSVYSMDVVGELSDMQKEMINDQYFDLFVSESVLQNTVTEENRRRRRNVGVDRVCPDRFDAKTNLVIIADTDTSGQAGFESQLVQLSDRIQWAFNAECGNPICKGIQTYDGSPCECYKTSRTVAALVFNLKASQEMQFQYMPVQFKQVYIFNCDGGI